MHNEVARIRVDPSPRPPGFLAGVSSLFAAARYIFATPGVWPLAAVPGLLLTALSTGCVWAAIAWVEPAVRTRFAPGAWYGDVGGAIVAWLAAAAFAVLGVLVALALAPALAGPALERIVTRRELALGVPPRRPLGWAAEIWCGVRAQAFAAMFALPLLGALWLVGVLAPPAAVVTTPLEFVVASLSLAWNLLDYPLTLRGVRMRERFDLVKGHASAVLGFGCAFSLLCMVPCFNVLMLPVGVAAATALVWQILERDPRLLPGVARRQF